MKPAKGKCMKTAVTADLVIVPRPAAQSLHQAKSKHQTIKCKINNTGFYESTNNAETLFGELKHWQNERLKLTHIHSIFNISTTQAAWHGF